MATYVAITTTTVGSSGATDITFSSIPATYNDLLLKLSARDATASSGTWVKITFNANTSSYSNKYMEANGSSVGNGTAASEWAGTSTSSSATASTFSIIELYIPNYAGSNNKSFSTDSASENNGTTAYAGIGAGLWSNTAAITSIKVAPNNGSNFSQYTTATLYGISNT